MSGKKAPTFRASILLSAAVLAGAGSWRSAMATVKGSSGTDLSSGTSWVGNFAPGVGDVATFNATANATADTLGADDSWLGILLQAGVPNVAIGGANLLTLGSSGIDLSNSGATLTLGGGGVALAAPETWSTGTVASGLLGISSTISLASNLLTIDGAGTSNLSGIISGIGGLVKNGAGTLVLAAQNTYAGGTTLTSGLTIAGTSSTQTTALGSGLLTLSGSASMRLGAANQALTVEGLSSAPGTGLITGFGGLNSLGTLTIHRAPSASSAYGGTLANGTSGSLTLLLTGGGTQTLNGANTYTGSTIVRNGVLEISGGSITSSSSGATSGQNGIISVGDTAGQNAILLIDGGVVNAAHNGNFGVGAVTIGDNNSAGAIYLNSGTITTGTNEFWTGSTGSGYVRQKGGVIISNGYFPIGRPANTNQQAGVGIVEISGGTLTHTNFNDFEIGAYDPNKIADPTQIHGVLLVSGGLINDTVGNFQVSNYLNGVATIWSKGVVNATAASGTDIQNHDGSDLNGTRSGTGLLGVLNLGAVSGGGLGVAGGGTLVTSRVQHTGLNTGILNFHGGTLEAGNSGTVSFITGLTHAYVYGEGGTIDSHGVTLTVDQPLEGPSGVGLMAIPLASSGSGYIAPPVVTILGGTGATQKGTSVGITASALFDINTSSISGIAITNPGSGLQLGDSLTITLTGGGATVPATLVGGSVTLLSAANTAPNGSGNLIFTGGGTVNLTATNTFQGTLTVAPSTTVVLGSALAGGGTSGTFTGSQIVNNGMLLINRSNGVALPPTVTGSGTLTQSGSGQTTLTGAANYTGPTIVSGGTLSFSGGVAHSIGAVTGTGALLVDTSTTLTSDGVNLLNGTWIINGTQTLRSSAGGGAYAMFAAGHGATALTGTSVTSNLAFGAGAHLDLRNNAMIVEATSANKAALLQALAGDVGSGVITSSTAAGNPAYGLEVVDNGVLGATMFGGVAVDGSSIIVTQALLGDANLDGVVNPSDLLIWANNFNNTGVYAVTGGDFNLDSVVNPTDLLIWANNFNNNIAGNGVPSIAGGGLTVDGGGTVAAPEPASLALVALGGIGMLVRRKRRGG